MSKKRIKESITTLYEGEEYEGYIIIEGTDKFSLRVYLNTGEDRYGGEFDSLNVLRGVAKTILYELVDEK